MKEENCKISIVCDKCRKELKDFYENRLKKNEAK